MKIKGVLGLGTALLAGGGRREAGERTANRKLPTAHKAGGQKTEVG